MECKFCPKKFKLYRDCCRHMRKDHAYDAVAEKKREKSEAQQPALPFNFQRDVKRNTFDCLECGRQFLSADERDMHSKTHSRVKPYSCSRCNKTFAKALHKRLHEGGCLSNKSATWSRIQREEDDTELTLANSALKKVAETYKMEFGKSEEDMLERFQESLKIVCQKLKDIQHDANFKFYISLKCSFFKPTDPDVVTDPPVVFNSETCRLLPTTDIVEQVEVIYSNIMHQIETYQENGSGWSLKNLLSLHLNIMKYDPLKASSFIELPTHIKGKNACINIQNDDQKCFVWSVLAHLHPVEKHSEYVSHYQPFEAELNMSGISHPVAIKDIIKFERQNNISVNVFAINETKLVFPVRITEEKKEQHVNMIYISNAKNNHYILIKNMSRLLSGQLSNHNGAKHICDYCLHGCTSKRVLDLHVERCKEYRAQLTQYPPEGSVLKFTKFEQQLPLPFYIVGDLETIQEPIQTVLPNPKLSSTTKYVNHKPYSAAYMILSSDPGFYQPPKIFKGVDCIVEFLDALQDDVVRLKDILRHPIEMNLSDEEEEKFQQATTCHICGKEETEEDAFVRDHDHLTGIFRNAAHNSCNLNYRIKPDVTKIPIFFHGLKNYDSHLILSHVNPKKHGRVTCIPKNMEQYISFSIGDVVFKDSFGFMSKSLDNLVKTLKPSQLNKTYQYLEYCAGKEEERICNVLLEEMDVSDSEEEGSAITQVKKRKSSEASNNLYPHKRIRKSQYIEDEADASDQSESDVSDDEFDSDFIDDEVQEEDVSFYHRIDAQIQSIDITDVSDYRSKPYVSPNLDIKKQQEIKEKFQLLQRKGVYPYEYMDSFERFEEKKLPPPEKFYSSLNGEEITEDDYDHAKEVWSKFNCKNLEDYHDLYLLTDILLLADVINSFRDMCVEYYNIDPLHSYTAPGFAWQAALKMTDVNLELLSDKDMYTFFESGKRGGVSIISHRHATSNVPGSSTYNPEEPTKYLIYLDANNLYGWAMSQPLPIGEFEWVTDVNVLEVPDDAEHGYMIECDLEYPEELHSLHSDYPLCPEKMFITKDMLSPYQNSLLEAKQKKSNKKTSIGKIQKLVPNLNDKSKYIIHYRVLKEYVRLGIKVTKIHRTLKFRQAPWLKKFIDFNTKKRAVATSEFAKDFFKLLNNSVFGKTMENVREHRNVDLVNLEKKALKLASHPTFRAYRIFHENLIAVERYRSLIKMDKPIYTGAAVLDLSKSLMYSFHYDYIKKNYPGEKSLLCFTDTDSLLYQIETQDIYKDMVRDHHHFDFSGYPDNHSCFQGLDSGTISELKRKNKKVVGRMKDELDGDLMLDFAGLRAKCYSFLAANNKNSKKKLKAIKKCVVSKDIQHKHYKDCLFSGKDLYATMNTFRSHNHHISTITQRKLALANYDDKRWICADGITTVAHGHYKTRC